MSDLVRFGIAIEGSLLEAFDRHIARRGYQNRSEALRDLVRAELARDAWERGERTVATISLIYDHHVRELTERLVEIQHDHGDRVISATHVHLDHDHCLEVILAEGPANVLKRLADQLIGAKGVLAGDVTGLTVVGVTPGKKPRKGAGAAAKEEHTHTHSHEDASGKHVHSHSHSHDEKPAPKKAKRASKVRRKSS